MNVDYNRLKIVSSSGKHIDNVNEFIEYLNTFDILPDDLVTYLNYVLSQLDKYDLDNKEELVTVINKKLENSKDNKISDKEALSEMTSLSSEFNRLHIVNISKEYTDSHRDLEYITFEHKSGETEVLFVQYQNKLEDYIEQNRDRLDSITPEEVFDYLKSNVNRNLEFHTIEEIEKNPDLVKHAVVKDDETISLEEKEVSKYIDEHNIEEDMTISVDYYGERLYKVKDFICKFAYIQGERKMQIIKETDLKLSKQSDEKGMGGDPEEEEVVEEITINNDYESEELNANEQNQSIDSVSYEELPIVPIDEENYNYVIGLLDNKELNGYVLTEQEKLFVMSYMKSLIIAMGDKEQSENISNDERILLENYIASNCNLNETDDLNVDVDNNYVEENDINAELGKNYLASKESLEKTRKDQKKLILDNEGRLGAANTVIILELAIVTMYVLGFIYYIK